MGTFELLLEGITGEMWGGEWEWRSILSRSNYVSKDTGTCQLQLTFKDQKRVGSLAEPGAKQGPYPQYCGFCLSPDSVQGWTGKEG